MRLRDLKNAVYARAVTGTTIATLLTTPTVYHKKALDRGMLRPFLMLATMAAVQRNEVAISLGWTLIESDIFGDAAAEAWEALQHISYCILVIAAEAWEVPDPT